MLNGNNAPLFEDSDSEQRKNRNHGRRIDGPRVFGRKQGSDCRYFCVERLNHQRHYVDPVTGAHAQAIERSWLDAKTMILKKMRGVGIELFQSHLDHFCWKMIRKDSDDLFVSLKWILFYHIE
uniref:Uncharacterized protein n=1 Tax=Octopus bimaculoides TaxID=37653 RepID=A0A0L8FR02_OCTBM